MDILGIFGLTLGKAKSCGQKQQNPANRRL
jgi:hypothetical protein